MVNYNIKTIKLSYANTAYTFVLWSFDFLFPKYSPPISCLFALFALSLQKIGCTR